METGKVSSLPYAVLRAANYALNYYFCHPHVLRNELKHRKESCVILANHESVIDFTHIISLRTG